MWNMSIIDIHPTRIGFMIKHEIASLTPEMLNTILTACSVILIQQKSFLTLQINQHGLYLITAVIAITSAVADSFLNC